VWIGLRTSLCARSDIRPTGTGPRPKVGQLTGRMIEIAASLASKELLVDRQQLLRSVRVVGFKLRFPACGEAFGANAPPRPLVFVHESGSTLQSRVRP
jgi:hypothetical protein